MAVFGGEDVNRSPLIQVLTWFLFLVGVFSLCARLGSKLFMSLRITVDDWLALAAQGFLLLQGITLSVGATNGLGKALDTLSEEEIQVALKAEYAYMPLFLLALALIKWSLSTYISELTPNKAHRLLSNAMMVIVGLWLGSAMLVGLFQCHLPAPWNILNPQTCINRGAWWTYVTAVNIATEFAFVGIYLSIFHGLQTTFMRKASIRRVAAAAGVQLATFVTGLPTGDEKYNGWLPIVCNQMVACLSITTACVPYLRPFMQSIELSVIQVNEDGSQEELSQRHITAPRSRQDSQGGSRNSGSGRPSNMKRGEGSGGFRSQLSQISHPAAVRV